MSSCFSIPAIKWRRARAHWFSEQGGGLLPPVCSMIAMIWLCTGLKVPCFWLHCAGGIVFNSHLFLFSFCWLQSIDLPPFYNGHINAWWLLLSAQPDHVFLSVWILEDRLFFNPLFPTEVISSRNLFVTFTQAELTKLSHLIVPSWSNWKSAKDRAVQTRVWFAHFLDKILTEFQAVLIQWAAQYLQKIFADIVLLGGILCSPH